MKDDSVYLKHILEAITKIESYAMAGETEFFARSHWQDAIIRQLEIIGEATRHLSEKFRAGYPEVHWRRISGLRNVLIHQYMGVDIAAVWQITRKDLPPLKAQVQRILPERMRRRRCLVAVRASLHCGRLKQGAFKRDLPSSSFMEASLAPTLAKSKQVYVS